MAAWLESFLITLSLKVIQWAIQKGKLKAEQFADLQAGLAKARKYQDVVNDPKSTREDRKKAEDDLLS